MKQYITLLLLALLVGCTKIMPSEEYIRVSNTLDGPLSVQVEQGGYAFSCFYRPTDFFVAQTALFEKRSPREVQTQVNEKYGSGTYFIVSINSETLNPNMQLFGQSFSGGESMNLLYGLSPNFTLVSNVDTVKCEVVTINRSWGNSEEVSLLLLFPKIPEKSKIKKYQLKIQDFGLGCGTVMVPLKKINPTKIALKL